MEEHKREQSNERTQGGEQSSMIVQLRSMILVNGNDVTILTGNDFMIDDELTI